jgi:hypothetical protein
MMDSHSQNPWNAFTASLVESARKSVASAREFALDQIDGQVGEFAAKLHATSGNLHAVTSRLRSDPFVAPVAPLVEQAEAGISRAALYLDGRGVERIAVDIETFSRERPIAATLIATVAGFALSRAIKASSLRRGEAA